MKTYLLIEFLELDSMNPPLWGRTRFAWGRRRASPTELAPALPLVAQTTPKPGEASIVKPYPEFHVYKSKEEALQHQTNRNRGKTVPLPAYPS